MHGNTYPLSAYTELTPAPLLLLPQRLLPPQRFSLLLAAILAAILARSALLALLRNCSSSDLRSLGGSHSLGKFFAAPHSLPRQLSLSSRLLLERRLSLSLQRCSARLLLLRLLVGPAADRRAVDPTAATKCERPELRARNVGTQLL